MDRRYAIYWAPEGPLAEFGASWLGWDAVRGQSAAAPVIAGLPDTREKLIGAAGRYGLHATLKAPFAPKPGTAHEHVLAAAEALAARLAPAEVEGGLALGEIGGFLALLPVGDTRALDARAAEITRALEDLRAPLTDAERARRGAERLPPDLRENLERWGYPYVMEAFRFHVTLTGNLDAGLAAVVRAALEPHLGPLLPRPFRLDAICLFGEDPEGRFHLRRRFPLGAR